MKNVKEEVIELLESAREDLQNCYGRDTELTERITEFLELYAD